MPSQGDGHDRHEVIVFLHPKRSARQEVIDLQAPVDPKNPLLPLDNAVITPPNAGATYATRFPRLDRAFSDIAPLAAGEAPTSVKP